tara:strand:+ start:430 stop:666 length:237 start_codon:yes stop_codon:yes gene_type:complete
MTQEEEFKKDLELLESELRGLKTQLSDIDSQRVALASRIQQVSGAAAYLRGKLQIEEPVEEEKVEEKPDETTEEKSEG